MASPDRTSADDLSFLQLLQKEPYRGEFFAVLRALECMYPDMSRLGRSSLPGDDPVRLGQEVSLAFPPSELAAFEPGQPNRLMINFMGLLGPNGPMPLHLTEYVHDRLLHENDPTIAAFLDIFHHRMMSLFYRAWADCEPTVSLDRPESDRFSTYVAALIGFGMESLQSRDDMPDWSKYYFSGRLTSQTRNAEGLIAIVSDFFKSLVEIEEFVGQWIQLPDQSLCGLGVSRHTASIGVSATIGTRVWDYQQTFRLVIGPVDFEVFKRLLPGNEGLKRLTSMVRTYCGDEFAWELKLLLKCDEIPQIRLGEQGRLGWTTWIKDRPHTVDTGDLVLSPVLA